MTHQNNLRSCVCYWKLEIRFTLFLVPVFGIPASAELSTTGDGWCDLLEDLARPPLADSSVDFGPDSDCRSSQNASILHWSSLANGKWLKGWVLMDPLAFRAFLELRSARWCYGEATQTWLRRPLRRRNLEGRRKNHHFRWSLAARFRWKHSRNVFGQLGTRLLSCHPVISSFCWWK